MYKTYRTLIIIKINHDSSSNKLFLTLNTSNIANESSYRLWYSDSLHFHLFENGPIQTGESTRGIARQIGQLAWAISHLSTHSGWKQWLHSGNTFTCSLSPKIPRHILHSAADCSPSSPAPPSFRTTQWGCCWLWWGRGPGDDGYPGRRRKWRQLVEN